MPKRAALILTLMAASLLVSGCAGDLCFKDHSALDPAPTGEPATSRYVR